MSDLVQCDRCGKLVAKRFPVHTCCVREEPPAFAHPKLCHSRREFLAAIVGVKEGGMAIVHPDHQTYSQVDTENRMWIFDVEAGYAIARRRGDYTAVYVEDFGTTATIRARYRGLDEERIRGADLTRPVLAVRWVENSIEGILLIDGYHRMVRASEEGQALMPAFILRDAADVEEIVLAVATPEVTATMLAKGF
jgi:hypothetical protein